MDSDLDFDQTQAVVISDFEDDDLTDDLESSGEKEPCAYLRVLAQRDLPGSSHPVYEGDNIVGRQSDTCHVCISSKSLSKEHACIQVVADSHLIFDKGSSNKTRRGKLVLKPEIRYELKHGDVISFADVKCVYEIIKQMSEIVPESDTDTDAESDESLHLRHDVTNQSDKLIDLTGEKEDSSDRGVNKTSVQQTLVLSESDSEDDDVPSGNSMNNRTAVQETLVFESSDDDDSLDLIGMATQAYMKTDNRKDNEKPGKPSKMIADTQKYCNKAAEEFMETQSFDLDTTSDEEGTACLRETGSKSIGRNVSKAATKPRQATDQDSDEHSDDVSELFAVSTLACDDIVDVNDDGSDDEGPTSVAEAIAGQNPTSHSSTVAVPSDATVAMPSEATVAVPSDATVDAPSDVSVCIKSPSKRVSKKVWSKSVVSPVRVSSLRLAETLVAEDVVAASEKRPGDSDDMPSQIFEEWSCGSSSQNAAVASGRRLARYPSDVACRDGATAAVDDVFPVSGKILAGSRSKAAQKCVSGEPTQVFDVISDEPTQAFSAICDEPTQAYGGIYDEATQAYGGISDEPTQDYGGISDEPTQVFHDPVGKPTQVRGGISNKPTQIHDDSSDKPTQILNDSTENPTQLLNDSSDKPTQVHNDTYDEPTQTFIIDSDDSDEVSVIGKTKSHINLCDGKDQLATAGGSAAAGKQSDKTRADSAHTLPVGDDNLQRRVSDGTVVDSDASEEDEDATQAFVDEAEEEDDENDVGKAEDPTQRYLMEAEERLEILANYLKGSTDATARRHPDSSDDSDLEELSVLKSAETLPDDSAHLFESTSQSHTSLSTNAEPTLRYDMAIGKDPTLPYDMAIGKDPTLPYDMAIDKDPTLPYDMAIDKDPTLPYDMGVKELPGKVKKRQSPKRKRHNGSEHDGGKELDISADTKKVSDGTNPCTELSSPVIPLPAKSPLKSALVDRRRSPSPSPGNRRVAFAVTVKEDKVDKQTSASGSANTRQSLPSHKSDQGILSPTRLGRSRNKLSLQQMTAFEQSHDDKSQGKIIEPGQLNLTSQIQENLLGVEQSKVGDLEIQGLKSGMNAQKTSIRVAHRTSTRRSKVQSAAEDVTTVSDTPPQADDVNPSGSTPPLSEDVNPSGSTLPLVEGTSRESLTPQAGNRRRKLSDEQGDGSTSGKESDNIVVSASKRSRKSVVVTTEEAVDPAGGRRSSARPKKKISYQQLATGVEKKRDKQSIGPSEEAESGGTAAVNLVHNSSNKTSKKSAVSMDDSNNAAGKKSAVSLDDSNTAAGKKSAVSSDDSNTRTSKKPAASLNDSNTKASKKSAASLDDSNTAAGKKSAASLDDSNTAAGKKSAVSSDDSNTRTSRKSAASSDDSKTKASNKPAVSLDDSNTKASKKSAVFVDDSNTKASKKSAASLDDSDTKASKKSAVFVDDSNTKANKKSAASLDDSNTKASKKPAVSSDDSNTKASKKPAVSLDDSNTKASKKSAVSLDDSNTKTSKKPATSLDDSNTKASKKPAVSLDDSNTKASKISVATLLDGTNTRTSRKSAAPSDDSNTNTREKPIKPASKKSVQSLANSNTTASEQQNTRRQRTNKQPKENTAKKDSKKTVRKSARPETEEKDDNDSDETESIASFVDDSTAIDDETPIRFVDNSSGKDNEQLKTGMTSKSIRKSRTGRTARESHAKEASKKVDNYEVSSDTVSTTSRKRLHSKDPGADRKSCQLERPSAVAQNEDVHAETRRKKKSVIAGDPGKDSSSTAVDSTPTHTEDSQAVAVKNVKSRSSKTVKLDASSQTLLSTDSNLPKHDSSRESIGGPTIHQEQTKAAETSRIGTRKSLQVEEKGKELPQQQVKTHTSHQAVRGKSRPSEVYIQPQTEEIQAPASRGKRATRSLVSSQASVDCSGSEIAPSEVVSSPSQKVVSSPSQKVVSSPSQKVVSSPSQKLTSARQPTHAAVRPSDVKRATRSLVSFEASVDCSGSEIAQSEVVSSPSQKSTSARKPAHAAVRPSDMTSRGKRSERAEPMISGNGSDQEGHGQNSASQQDKSSQISATQKTKLIHHSHTEKDQSSQNSTHLLKRKRAADSKLSQDGSQSNENKEQIVEQASTPHAKKSKQTPVLRTPTGKVHTEKADSPVLRKTSANSKPRVMFTGYLDKQGEKIVRDLGGELVTTVQDCSHLVTDRICRTVKFLSGLAKGLLIVSPRWLESCKQAGTFVDGHQFLVSDPAMEKQYKFTLATSISQAQAGPLLVGYKVHVTRSVKPDPTQMQDILKFAGAQYLKTMPTKSQEKLVVISCSEDESLCLPAVKAGIPVVGAEFILTGILRQELDFESFSLFQDEPKSQKKTGKKK